MPTIEELRKTRIEKLKKLKDAGLLAYPAKTNRTNSIAEAVEEKNFKKIIKREKESCSGRQNYGAKRAWGSHFFGYQ